MKKTYQTNKTKEEILAEIENLRENSDNLRREDKVLYPIWFVKGMKLRVDCTGSGTTYWKLNAETPGQIHAKRCVTFMDCALVFLFVVLDCLIGYLIFRADFTLQRLLYGALILLGIVLCEFIPTYCLRVLGPARKLKKFVQKYLGGDKADKKSGKNTEDTVTEQ